MYKKLTSISFYSLILVLAVLPGCFWDTKKEALESAALKEGLIVADVNSKEMYDDCHIKGAQHVAIADIDAFAATLDKEKTDVVFYCSNYMCAASGAAAQKLMKLGFKSVAAYEGGIAEWHQKGLPTDGPAQGSYLSVAMEKPAHEEKAYPVIEAPELAVKMGLTVEQSIDVASAEVEMIKEEDGGIAKW
jgi:rhodanese-related sulfurtransferase